MKINYNQRMDIKFNHLEHIDVNDIVKNCNEDWFNQTLTKVNERIVRLEL